MAGTGGAVTDAGAMGGGAFGDLADAGVPAIGPVGSADAGFPAAGSAPVVEEAEAAGNDTEAGAEAAGFPAGFATGSSSQKPLETGFPATSNSPGR